MQRDKRMSISLGPTSDRQLEQLAKEQDISLNEALRRAISTEYIIQQAINKGSEILIKDKEGQFKQVIFR